MGGVLRLQDFFEKFTPPKTYMEPENDGSQKGISSSRGFPFSGSMLVFGGVGQIAYDFLEVQGLEVQSQRG